MEAGVRAPPPLVGSEGVVEAGGAGVRAGTKAAELGGEWAVHPDCALEFAERFVRRDIALAGRVQAVRLLHRRWVKGYWADEVGGWWLGLALSVR